MNYINVNWQHNIEGARQYFLQVENAFFCFLQPELNIHSFANFPWMLLLKSFVQKSKDEIATVHFWGLLFGSMLLMPDMYTYLVNISP